VPQGSASPGDKGVRETLKVLGPRSRALAWVLFLVYLIFGVAIFGSAIAGHLSTPAFIAAAGFATAVFIVGIVALTKIEMKVEETRRQTLVLVPSSATPDSAVLNGLVNSTLEVICRATSLPDDPAVAGMRAFIFKVEGDKLMCRYFWALNPTTEEVAVTSFPLTEEAAEEVAVVECVLRKKTTRTEVQPLSADLSPELGPVDSDLRYVLAAPIWNETSTEVWGTVDFDASNHLGRERLSSEAAKAAILGLTQHLRVIFNLTEPSANPASKPAGRTRRRSRPKAVSNGKPNGKADAPAVVA
jgi:hypothetical protein